MNLFSFFNNLAGQSALIDALMRFFYVASVPIGATLWLALLFFRRESRVVIDENADAARLFEYSSRRAVVSATFFALMVCAALWFAFEWLVESVLQTPILSPRPFVTHWVNLLVVEPNDNSFPSPEAILLGVLWIASWALSPRAHWVAFALAILGCVARVFCGTHYIADVIVGLGVGAAVCALSMATFGVVLRLSPKPFRQRAWRLRVQGAAGLAGVLAVLVFGISTLRQTPRLLAAWQERRSSSQLAVLPKPLRDIEYSHESSQKSLHEGEGAPAEKRNNTRNNAPSSSQENTDAHGKTIPRVGETTIGGFLPREETRLLRALQRAKLAHALVSVEVAALRDNVSRPSVSRPSVSRDKELDKGFAMHFASVRFQVRPSDANERRRVAQTAQRIVKIAFANDSALQSVDVIGVVLNDPARDGVRYPVFAIGAIPVWTASIQRQSLVSKKFAPILNSPNADAGLWLRARSRLYINERVLQPKNASLISTTSLFNDSPTSSTRSTPKPVAPPKKVVPSKPKTQTAPLPPRAMQKQLSPQPSVQKPLSTNAQKPKSTLTLKSTLKLKPTPRTSSTRTKATQNNINAQNSVVQPRVSTTHVIPKRGAKVQKPQPRKASATFRARGEQ